MRKNICQYVIVVTLNEKNMTVEARKLHFIEEFLKITDEKIISQMEAIMRNEELNHYEQSLKPMSMSEFHSMVDQAKQDVENGRVTSHESLKQEIQAW